MNFGGSLHDQISDSAAQLSGVALLGMFELLR
jgi:hypothetical protein